jgi:hypothetical protein
LWIEARLDVHALFALFDREAEAVAGKMAVKLQDSVKTLSAPFLQKGDLLN